MKNKMSIRALVQCAKIKDDVDLKFYLEPIFEERFGKESYESIKKALDAEDEDLSLRELSKSLSAGCEKNDIIQIIIELNAARKDAKIPVDVIMEMYRSGDESFIQFSKKYMVKYFSNYIYDIIHTYYNTYPAHYYEDLHQSGIAGIITAMQNYNEDKGMFTTYAKSFIIHEISEQLNFYNNDTSTYFKNLQKKIRNAIEEIKNKGFEPTVENISLYTDMRPEIVQRELECMERSRITSLDDEEAKVQVSSYNSSPEHIVMEKDKYMALYESISRLPELMGKCIEMKYLRDYTNDTISKELDIQPSKVKALSVRAIQLLKKDLELVNRISSRREEEDEAQKIKHKYMAPPEKIEKDIQEQIDELMSFDLFQNKEVETEDVSKNGDEKDGFAMLKMIL